MIFERFFMMAWNMFIVSQVWFWDKINWFTGLIPGGWNWLLQATPVLQLISLLVYFGIGIYFAERNLRDRPAPNLLESVARSILLITLWGPMIILVFASCGILFFYGLWLTTGTFVVAITAMVAFFELPTRFIVSLF